MATLLDIKMQVAGQMGKTDYGSINIKRDIMINAARREFYSYRKWSFLKKTADITFASGEVAFPTDYNPSFDVGQIYSYDATEKTNYDLVAIEDLDSYEDTPVFAVDLENKKILTNTDGTVKLTYFHLPTDKALDGSENANTEPAPDITAIALLASAKVWLNSERDEDNHDRFMRQYSQLLGAMVLRDSRVGPPKNLERLMSKYNLGYNS